MLHCCYRLAVGVRGPVLLLRSVQLPAGAFRTVPSRRLVTRALCAAVSPSQNSVASIMTEPLAAAGRADEGEYKAQLEHKISRVKELFKGFQLPDLETFESERSHYRMRCVGGVQLCSEFCSGCCL